MACRVHQQNKKTGVTYVYESHSYWDKEKRQPRNKRICIGKLDPNNREFIPSKRLASQQSDLREAAVTATAEVIGPLVILDTLTKQLGLSTLLKSCFPDHYHQIQMMAYYLAVQGGALSHCALWCKSHVPHIAPSLTSQRISEILSDIDIDAKQTFLNQWMKQVLENDYLCYDITSISSYAECNEFIKYGYNRDKESLPQLNLAVLFGQKSGLPAYFHHLPGNITDVTTLCNLLKTFKALDIRQVHCVMDRGFYSKNNINQLVKDRHKFMIGVPIHNKWVRDAIDEIYEKIHTPHGYRTLDQEVIYVHSRLYSWGTLKRRCYLHIYFNAQSKADAVNRFCKKLLCYKRELETGAINEKHKEAYKTYFIVKTTPKRGTKVMYNDEAVDLHVKRYAGFHAILTNFEKEPLAALQIYRNKDKVEKCFDDLKNQLDMKRLRIHSTKAQNGRLFVQFLSLIYISALRNKMKQSNLHEKYTARELLQEMNTLIKIKYTGKRGHILTELTKPQKEILSALNIIMTET